jgi:hypothetical protein
MLVVVGWVATLLIALQSAVEARKHHADVLGANFIMPSMFRHDRELERQSSDHFLEVDCDGKLFAGVGVDEHAMVSFVKHSEPSCSVSIDRREIDYSPETTEYLRSLWKVHRLLTHSGHPGSLEESYMTNLEQELISASHSIERVLDTAIRDDARHNSIKLMEQALGPELKHLNHPSREAAKEVLSLIKKNFNFFHGDKCLVKSHNGQACGDSVLRLGASSCNEEESHHMCSYSELYQCPQCGASFRFPRYRSVPKLLETKLGRCGEFSDVALAVFNLLGYESKQVIDHTDHVWIEIGIPDEDGKVQFVHGDPSEGILDEPFLYQDNWKKQLTFVFSHTPTSTEDRTNIYWHPEQHRNIVERRGMSDEELSKEVFNANIELESKANVAVLEKRMLEQNMGSFNKSRAAFAAERFIDELEVSVNYLAYRLK